MRSFSIKKVDHPKYDTSNQTFSSTRGEKRRENAAGTTTHIGNSDRHQMNNGETASYAKFINTHLL